MLESIKSNFNTKAGIFIIIAVIVDLLMPFAPSIGTVAVAVLCGPWAAALTSVLLVFFSAMIYGINLPVSSLIFLWAISIFIGYFAGRMAQLDYFKSWWKAITAGLILGVIQLFASTIVFDSNFSRTQPFVDVFFIFFYSVIAGSILYTIISCLIVFVLIKRLPDHILDGFPQSQQVSTKSDTTGSQKLAAGIAGAILIPIAIFIVWFVIIAFLSEI